MLAEMVISAMLWALLLLLLCQRLLHRSFR